MKRQLVIAAAALILVTALFCGQTLAVTVDGAISTDRFGYTGVVTKYTTLGDAQNGTNAVETINIGNRDMSLYITSGYNIIMGSWWYTTAASGSAGWGNTSGNTGVGFIQLYEEGIETVTSVDMAFQNFDGAYWTEFTMSISGENADYANSYARFSPFSSNTNDSGIYLDYNLTLTAYGLEGLETSPGFVEASNQPTGVTGAFTGIFQNTAGDPLKDGFYVFTLTLDMTNWSWENRDSLTGDPFAPSYFAAPGVSAPVPEPATMVLFGAGLVGLAGVYRMRKAKKA